MLNPEIVKAPISVVDVVVLAERLSARFRRAFEAYLRRVEQSLNEYEVADSIQSHDLRSILQMVVEYLVDFPGLIADMFSSAGRDFAAEAQRQLEQGVASGLSVKFDVEAVDAASALKSEQLRFIKEISDGQRDLIEEVIRRQLQEGANPLEAAREIKQSIGLTSNQWQWVRNYQDALERSSRSALDRALRDRRYDRTVERVIANDDVLSASQIERMVGAYTKRMIQYRAQTIARTESLRTLSIARHEAWRQAVDQSDADPDRDVEKTWIATLDDRVRDTHEEMHHQKVIGLDTPFESPSGELLLYPCDPEASAEETINCLLPGTNLESPDLVATARGYFDGEVVIFETAGGRHQSVTINHPVLTHRGFKPAHLLDERDYLVCYVGSNSRGMVGAGVDANYMPTSIEYVHDTGAAFCGAEIVRAVDFHGDVINGNVEIKVQANSLLFYCIPYSAKSFGERVLGRCCMRATDSPSLCPLDLYKHAVVLPAPRRVGRCDLNLSLFLGHLRPFEEFSLASSSWPHSKFYESRINSSARAAVVLRECLDRSSCLVTLDKVVKIRRNPFRGHVYSPQTLSGLYVSGDGVVNHNCRCTVTMLIRQRRRT